MSIATKIAELNGQRAKALERFYGGTKIVENAERDISAITAQVNSLRELDDAGQADPAANQTEAA